MNPTVTVFVIARQTGARLLKSRVLWLMTLGTVAVAGLFFLASRRFADQMHGDEAFGLLAFIAYMNFVLPFSALYLGIVGVQGDLEDRTSVYLFARSLSRPAMLLGKWLAAALVAAVLTLAGIALLYYALSLRSGWRNGMSPPASMLTAFAHVTCLAALAYAGLGVLFGAWLKRPLIMGIVFLVGWEGVFANLASQATARSFTVADPVRRLLYFAHHPRHQYEEALLGPWKIRPDELTLAPTWALLRFTAIVLSFAVWIYSRREYDARVAE